MSRDRGRPIVFAAPSGAGKTTIIRRVMEELGDLVFSISSTTRPRRKGERDGVDYDFLTEEQFARAVEEGDFIEWEPVHLHRYGTRRSRVEPLFERGKDVVFDLDVLGALSIRKLYPDALLIFIDVPGDEMLMQRLRARGREDETEIAKRLERAVMERSHRDAFDAVVVNDDLERAVREVVALIRSYRREREA